MLELADLPDAHILGRFAERYPEANIESVLAFLTLLHTGTALTQALNQYLAKYDLLQGRWWVLILLMRESDFRATQSKLAEKAGVSRATMTGLLDGLLRENLITREPATTDRRQVMIRLTEAGQARLDSLMPGYYQHVSDIMGCLSPVQLQSLQEAMRLLNQQRDAFFSDPS
ncbi:Transcriptional regulator, MarR family [Methylophaga frappieri]|uniref:Transcriptional regulator, MarR family n=1 Tax=Methylophaga frappieri (strain ATCC BAA-2434 / DSM 25690 / JAM7) TaxID=754477 RepID=I1YH34_METFJ|nr:MarR family transcriptional regulator [Methylophaga frappieri]AFJ02227.1 Transcriptional regulator, MarR family [Methylophaga frappieri]